jgi:glycosyltransferase involved in cell wall biosynthesis
MTEIQDCQNSRFAVITHALPSGGAEKQSILLVSAMRKAGIESELFLLDHLTIRNSTHLSICQAKDIKPILCKMSNLENLQFVNLENPLVSELLNPQINPYALELANLLDMLLKYRINVLISSLDGNNIVALMASVILNLKIHISFRSYAPDRMSHINQEHAKQLYQALVKYKRIVFSGNSRMGNKDYSRYLNISETEILFIENFLDEDLRSQSNLPLELERELDIDVLGVMRLASEKNPILFLQYCYEIKQLKPKATFVLVGDGPMMDLVRKEILNLNLEKNLTLMQNTNIDKLLNSTKSVMLTSDFEGTPNIILESMAKGLPIFATKVGEISNLLSDGRGYLLNPSRISEDAQQIVKILDSSKIIIEVGTKSKKFISNWQNDSVLVNAFLSKFN